MNRIHGCIFLTFILLSSTVAQSSKDYALAGKKAWVSFECSSLAGMVGDTAESQRLFLLGYNEGKRFLKALGENKIKEKDANETLPIGITMYLAGPSDDFRLGRIYSAAQENALADVVKDGNELNSNELQKSLAEAKYNKCNCLLVK